MKKTNINFNNISYLNSIEKNIDQYLLENDTLLLYFKDLNFDKYNVINVYFKNIKTKEVFHCISNVKNNSILIDLINLKYLCTDYEYSLIIILEAANSYSMIYPRIKNTEAKSIIFNSSTDNIKWYFRILQNGKLRLSTVYLFSNINNSFESQISL